MSIVLYLLLLMTTYFVFMRLLKMNSLAVLSDQYLESPQKRYQRFVNYLSAPQNQTTVPTYKYFSSLVEVLQQYQRKYGLKIAPSLRDLRKAARIDYKEFKKITSQLFGLVFQYGFICGFTWIFLFYLQLSLGGQISHHSLSLLAYWQAFGLVFSLLVFWFIKFQIFKHFNQYVFSLYALRCLFSINLALSEVLHIAKIDQLKDERALSPLKRRIVILVKSLRSHGQFNRDELDVLCHELWDIFEQKLELLVRLVLALKLMGIAIFALPGFLYGIYLSMGQMLGI